ncbi:MAG: aldehyde dehydrogenase [Proteocatella sp.]
MKEIVSKQRKYFNSNATKDLKFRIKMLERLRVSIEINEAMVYSALKKDLNKSESEAYITEIQMVKSEIKLAINKLQCWAKPVKVKTPITLWPSKSYMTIEPYGVTLIMAPWNYPFQLAMTPLVGAIASGNCAVVKTSRNSKYTSEVVSNILSQAFKPEYVYCVDDTWTHEEILEQKYDFIFFTGSERAGKIVMEAASRHVTPVILELGGKSPCIVDRKTNVELAAKRIVWGKFLNAGQTCIAPDYVLVDEAVKERFLTAVIRHIDRMYPQALENKDYGKIINQNHVERLTGYMANASDMIGGISDAEQLKIAPAIFPNAKFSDEIMKEEIFGPILPIISYTSLDEAIQKIKHRPKPLALYIFSNSKYFQNKIISSISSGGVCINDVIMHMANENLPFGGVGGSGMGNYHGHYSFKTFSHTRGILKNKNCMDMPFRYPPYKEDTMKLIKFLTK